MKIAIFSSANNEISKENRELAQSIAHYLRQFDVTLVTGGSLGIPGLIVEQYKALGGKTVMFSPDTSHDSHLQRHDNHGIDYYDEVIYGEGFTERSLKMIRSVDGAIALNGRTGTLCESLIALEEALPLAVIESAGGIAEKFNEILEMTGKETFNFFSHGHSHTNQIDRLIDYIKQNS